MSVLGSPATPSRGVLFAKYQGDEASSLAAAQRMKNALAALSATPLSPVMAHATTGMLRPADLMAPGSLAALGTSAQPVLSAAIVGPARVLSPVVLVTPVVTAVLLGEGGPVERAGQSRRGQGAQRDAAQSGNLA